MFLFQAHPPRRDDPIRRNVCYQAATTLILPGVVPETPFEFDANRLSSSSRRGESLIKMHPPKKPQRLEDTDLMIKTIESDAKVTAVEAEGRIEPFGGPELARGLQFAHPCIRQIRPGPRP
ncbi:hypothetical protein CEXT_483631 [Caerostris extrusa]|uniref:Uncharacterized protein n=1 Tax=Caerostris extrusa TaxID=172846 RepID=A0AAV4NBV4_CAEEX|nr:hypothetical protein CEXT_483631 [Caerostris extrusa]